jgi:hypothetical protein
LATTEEIDAWKATLATLKATRVEIATTGGIKEVWRDGRRMVFERASLKDLNDLIATYETMIADAEATNAGTGRKRYRALGVRF